MERAFAYAARHPLRVLAGTVAFLAVVFLLSLFTGGDESSKQDVPTASPPPVVPSADDQQQEIVDKEYGADLSELPPAEIAAYEEYKKYLKSKNWKGDPHFEGSAQSRRQASAYLQRQQALYDLPYKGKAIKASYIRVTEDSRYLIKVKYNGSLSGARKEWRQYLRSRNDSGRTYIVIFQKW